MHLCLGADDGRMALSSKEIKPSFTPRKFPISSVCFRNVFDTPAEQLADELRIIDSTCLIICYWVCPVFSLTYQFLASSVPPKHRSRSRLILGDAKGFAWILPNLPEKKFQKEVVSTKSTSCHFGRHIFQIKECWAPFLLYF